MDRTNQSPASLQHDTLLKNQEPAPGQPQDTRQSEFVLGLSGSILGLLFAGGCMIGGHGLYSFILLLGSFLNARITHSLWVLAIVLLSIGLSATLASILGMIGAVRVRRNGKSGGFLMLMAATIVIPLIFPAIPLFFAAIMSLRKPDQKLTRARWPGWISAGVAICLVMAAVPPLGLVRVYPLQPVTGKTSQKYHLNETVQMGDLQVLVTGAQLTNRLPMGDPQDPNDDLITNGSVILLQVTVTNTGQDTIANDYWPFEIIRENGDGDEFTYSPNVQEDQSNSEVQTSAFTLSAGQSQDLVLSAMLDWREPNRPYTLKIWDLKNASSFALIDFLPVANFAALP